MGDGDSNITTAAGAAPGSYGVYRLSDSAQVAIEYAAHAIAKDHNLRAGQTALFWALMSVASKHIADARAKDGVL